MDPALETSRARRRASRLPGNYRATILKTPTVGGPLTVRIAGDPAETVTPVEFWRPREDGTVPPKGAQALVLTDSTGRNWLQDWHA